MAASFIDKDSPVYLEELAEYLDARGLDAKAIPHTCNVCRDLGYMVDGQPLALEGWAFYMKDMMGETDTSAMLFRPCNWPATGKLTQRRGNEIEEVDKPPKFIQLAPRGHEFLNWVSPFEDMVQSPVVVFHEKTTSAYLCNQVLGAPTLALSGCWNWSKGRAPKPSLAHLLKNMRENAVLMVCFDGDIATNRNVMQAASSLKGWVSQARPDISIVFPRIPVPDPDKMGWDDWTVQMGQDAKEKWLELLTVEGMEITSLIPPAWLMADYGVSLMEKKGEKTIVEHTSENYYRLLRHPNWSMYRVDSMGGQVFNLDDVTERYNVDQFVNDYIFWLEANVYRGMGSYVRASEARRAVDRWMRNPDLRASIPVSILEKLPEVTEEEARSAAHRLITDGIRVTGPMTPEDTVETILRVCRDMVSLWTEDPTVDPQWALALVGPSGCGKSNFPKSFLGVFQQHGYDPAVAQFMKEGNRASLEEVLRVARDSMIGVYDEYDPDDRCAKSVEQNLFTMSTLRKFKQRQMREEAGTEQLRHASVMLTTTDKNRQYIRSGKDTGERRFITLEVRGVRQYGGILSSDREVITECGAVLLRWGLDAYRNGYPGDATEFSKATTAEFLGNPELLQRLGRLWARGDLRTVLNNFLTKQERKPNNSAPHARFTAPQFADCMLPGEKLSRQERSDLTDLLLDCGAKGVGQARVNTPSGDVMKDRVYEVEKDNYEPFIDLILSKV